jgi:hypothetical protein
MGISMGGLVARIALRKMELDGADHQTWKYISVDSPHKGANVPLGFQAAVRHIQNTNLQIFFINVLDYKNFDDAKNAVNLLNSTAVKQMLIYTVNSGYNFDNSVHNNFQLQYDQLGFPQKCVNVAISNGSNTGNLIFPAGSNLINVQYTYSFKWWMEIVATIISPAFIITNFPQLVINVIPGKSQLKVNLGVNALKNQTAAQIYNARAYIYKKILWFIPVNITITSKSVSSTSAMLPIDGAPGGLYDINNMGKLPFDDNAIKQKYFCFIPTVSSLALSNWDNQLTQPISESVLSTSCLFDYSYLQSNNERHTRFNFSASFLYDHLSGKYAKISGQDNLYSLQHVTYSVPHLPTGTTVIWGGGSNINIISGQGTAQVILSVCSGYSATITATLSGSFNQVLNKTIEVKPGNFYVTPYIDHADVELYNPYAQCYDWTISNYLYSDIIGNGNINCSNYGYVSLYSSSDDVDGGYISVRAKKDNCYSSWVGYEAHLWRPEIDGTCSYLNPVSGEPFSACLTEPVPGSIMGGGVEYYWYIGNTFMGKTNEPYIQSHGWPCGEHNLSVIIYIDNVQTSLSAGADFWGMCTGGGGWGTSSAAYPNPAGNELIIDRMEDGSAETAALSVQSAKGKASEIRVLLYSHSTAQLVYNKTYSSSEKQIKIDTSKLPNGIYHLNIIENGEKIKEQTIIVNH